MIAEQNGIVTTFRMEDVKAGWEQWFLLRSDAHFDSVHCRRELEKQHLDKAKERDAGIMDFGDTFDAMQGKHDFRRSYNELAAKYKSDNYYDLIVYDAADYYSNYPFKMFGLGNHESSIERHANTNIIARLVDRMSTEDDRVLMGGYRGWVRFMFVLHGTKRQSYNLYYAHSGGSNNAPVTRGVIDTNRQSVWLDNVDIVVNGHNHQSWIVPIKRETLSHSGRVEHKHTWFARIPGYKDGWGDSDEGFDVERNAGPRPQGALWLKFYYENDEVQFSLEMDLD